MCATSWENTTVPAPKRYVAAEIYEKQLVVSNGCDMLQGIIPGY